MSRDGEPVSWIVSVRMFYVNTKGLSDIKVYASLSVTHRAGQQHAGAGLLLLSKVYGSEALYERF